MNFLIIVLILISYITFKIYQSIRVPEGLKNVPTLNSLGQIIAVLTNASPDKSWEGVRETLEKEGIGKFWFKEWIVVINDFGLAKDIVTKADLHPKVSLEESFPGTLMAKYYGTNIVMSNGDVWKRHRRIANPSFRNLPIHVFVESAMELLKVMEKIDNEPIEVKDLMHRLALDVLGKAAFGFDFNNLGDPKNIYVTTYNEVLKELGSPLYLLMPFLENIKRTETLKKMERLNNLFDGIVEKKYELLKSGELEEKINNNSADLLEYMVKASNDPENPTLTNEELRYNLSVFMVAGHDTTANSLATILYIFATNKDVQKKARNEVLRVLGDDLTPNMEQQRELKYINMVINENQRLYPPVSQLQRRYPLQDIKFRNHVIPAKTPLTLYVYGIHHSSRNWENPKKFIPERFENEQHEQYALMGFGGGSRSCLGMNFSFIEQRIMLCVLLRKYEISLPTNSIHKDKLHIERGSTGIFGPRSLSLIFKRRTE